RLSARQRSAQTGAQGRSPRVGHQADQGNLPRWQRNGRGLRPCHRKSDPLLQLRGAVTLWSTGGSMNKPLYQVPSIADIRALPSNGYTVASSFSGCGGSSLGYRMAGFKVAYANEFVEAARETYRANCSPDTIIDPRDIRQVKPEDVLAALKMEPGQLD